MIRFVRRLLATSQQYFYLRTNQHQSPANQQYFSPKQITTSHQPTEQADYCFEIGYPQW
jgi:hypothetical protein